MYIILDAKYKKVDLNKVMTKQCWQLSTEEWVILQALLQKFEYMFDSNLGTCNTTPLNL